MEIIINFLFNLSIIDLMWSNLIVNIFPQILSLVTAVTVARPEAPRGRLQIPQSPPLRQQLPRQNYGPPTQEYGTPTPSASYGPAPDRQLTITKNVYVHLPPEDPEDNQPPQILEPQPPQKHYKLIFIKAPEPPKPTVPIIPAQPQDEHKTLSKIGTSLFSFLLFLISVHVIYFQFTFW